MSASDRPSLRSQTAQAHGNDSVYAELTELKARIDQLERENHEFARMYVEIQERHESLTNLYVASQRLHATFDPAEVKTIIREILVEMVGVDQFGLFVLEKSKSALQLVAGRGVDKYLSARSLPVDDEIAKEVLETGESRFSGDREFMPKSGRPLATLPLELKGRVVGVLVVYRMLSHKSAFSSVDHQLLALVASHAASALVSAGLHNTMDRKLKTIEGFIGLMRNR